MKLRIPLNRKAPFIAVVAMIAAASVTMAYLEDDRIAQEERMRSALVELGAPADLTSTATHEFWPVQILLCGLALAIIVFFAFHALWHAQQQAELRSTEQRLSLVRSQKRLRALFENAGEGICGLNESGDIIFANPTAARILGAAEDDLMGMDFAGFFEAEDRARKIPTDTAFDNTNDTPLMSVDGRRLIIDLTTTPMIDHSGETSGSVVIFRDITKRVDAEIELREANAELEEFAYRTAHDLRSPLVSATALLKSVGATLSDPAQTTAKRGIRLSVAALEGLERLVEDIQSLSRAKVEVEDDAPIDFARLTDDALERHTYLDGYDRLAIETDFAARACLVSKPRRVALIVNNLISNAIKYYNPAVTAPFIRVTTYAEGDAFFLEVDDNGLGIPADQRAHLFGMFRRFHPKVAFGSGLGLYMVKQSAEKIGASVYYEPRDAGSRFVVRFPLAQARRKAA